MSIHLPLGDAIGFSLAMLRATTFLFLSPPYTTAVIPAPARVAIAAGLAVAAAPLLAHGHLPTSTVALVFAGALQLVIGALIGLVVQCFVGAVQGAGALIDQFSGLNLPPAIDPLSLDQSPLLAQLYEWLATVLIFVSGADVLLAQGFEHSFVVVGTTLPHAAVEQLPGVLGADLVGLFGGAAEIAAPLVAVVVVAQLLLGLLAKSAPQANVFSIGYPLQLALVLFGLGLAVVALPADVTNLVERALSQLFA